MDTHAAEHRVERQRGVILAGGLPLLQAAAAAPAIERGPVAVGAGRRAEIVGNATFSARKAVF